MNEGKELQKRLVDLLSLYENGHREQAIHCMWELAGVESVRPVMIPDHIRRIGCPKS